MKNLAVCCILLLLAALVPGGGAPAPADAAWALGLLMVLAFLAQRLAADLRLPPICGWLAAGLALGAGGLDAVRPDVVPGLQVIHLFAGIWLAFEVGLGLTWPPARRYWLLPLTVALSTVGTALVVGAGTVYLARLPWELGLLVGALTCLWGPLVASSLSHSDEATLVGVIGGALSLLVLTGTVLLLHEQLYLPGEAVEAVGGIWLAAAAGAVLAEVLWRVKLLTRRAPAVVSLVAAFALVASLCYEYGLLTLPFGLAAGLVLTPHEERSRLLRHLLEPARRLAAMVFFALVGASLDPNLLFRAPAPGLYEILLLQALALVVLRGLGAAVWYPRREDSGFSRHSSWLLLPKGALVYELILRQGAGLGHLVPGVHTRLISQLATADILVYGFAFAALAAAMVSLFDHDELTTAV